MLFRKIGCLVGLENWVKRKLFSVDHKISPLIPKKHFCFNFTFKSLLELRHAKGERERERTTQRNGREREKEERVGRVRAKLCRLGSLKRGFGIFRMV